MPTNETFTSDEIMDIITEVGIDVSLTPADGKETFFPVLNCEFGDIEFFCFLVMQEPFFEGIKMYANRFDVENPVLFVNLYNQELRVSRASYEMDNDGLIQIDEDGDPSVDVRTDIHFAGGVTGEHLKFMFEMWLEDLFDFYEINVEESVNQSEETAAEKKRSQDSTLLEQVTACLVSHESMTSREIARQVGTDRHFVNSILYKHRNKFQNDGGQPPRWSLK